MKIKKAVKYIYKFEKINILIVYAQGIVENGGAIIVYYI